MTSLEIEQLFSQLQYQRDIRKPPDERRRGQFRAGWEDTTVRGETYDEETLQRLTWHNLGYRLGKFFGHQAPEQIDQAYEVLVKLYGQSNGASNWQSEVKWWLNARRDISPSLIDSGVLFFQRAFENTLCRDHAWFGVHAQTASLVVGGIFLAAFVRSGEDKGIWLLVDQNPPELDGIEYRSVKSTRGSRFPLVWGHSPSFEALPKFVASESIWNSYAQASEHILHAPRVSSDRNTVQQRRGKHRLTDIWHDANNRESHIFPDEVDVKRVFREGAVRQVAVNAYERNPLARKKCITRFGAKCCVCSFNFTQVYGQVAEGFIHVHHLRPISEIGAEYEIDPIKDLRPVCPNCHAVIHLREPAFSIEEVKEMLERAKGLLKRLEPA